MPRGYVMFLWLLVCFYAEDFSTRYTFAVPESWDPCLARLTLDKHSQFPFSIEANSKKKFRYCKPFFSGKFLRSQQFLSEKVLERKFIVTIAQTIFLNYLWFAKSCQKGDFSFFLSCAKEVLIREHLSQNYYLIGLLEY